MGLAWLFNWIRPLSVRSGKWKTVRAKHLEAEPQCMACLRKTKLEVHHILPVHAGGPELMDANLITLCHECHFCLGHACDWKAWRPDVKRLARMVRMSGVKRCP